MKFFFKSLLFLLILLPFFAFSAAVEVSDAIPVATTASPIIVVDSERINVAESNILLDCWRSCFCCFYRKGPRVCAETDAVTFAIVIDNCEHSSHPGVQAAAVGNTGMLPVVSTYPTEQGQIRSDRELAELLVLMQTLGQDSLADAVSLAAEFENRVYTE